MKTPVYNLSSLWQKDGELTDDAGNFISNLVQQLQLNFASDGHVIPSVSNDSIKEMQTEYIYGRKNNAYYQTKFVHDSTDNLYRVNNTNGKFLAIQTKLPKKWDAKKPWINEDRTLTQDASDFLAQLVEEKS